MAAAIAGAGGKISLLGITENSGQTQLILDALKRGKQVLDDKKIDSELINKSGEPIDQIVKWTTEVPYDLVLIGAIRKGRRGPFWMSSKAYKIVKSIRPPVLIVMGENVTIKKILICSGGKKQIENAVTLAGSLARELQAAVTLFHVMPEAPLVYTNLRREEEDVDLLLASTSELGRNLRHEMEALEKAGIPTDVHLRQGIVLKEIFKEIRQGHYDLVVTGSSLSSGALQTYVMGDVTREIVNRANLPVLIVRSVDHSPGIRESIKNFLHQLADTFDEEKPPVK